MRFFRNTVTLILFTLVVIPQAFCQELKIASKSEHYTIHSDTTYTNEVSVVLKSQDSPLLYPVFYDTEFEKVSDIVLYTKKRSRFKEVKDLVVRDEQVELDYITSKQVKFIPVPANTEARITYKIECKELMYLASLSLFSPFETDSLRYAISIPDQFSLAYDTLEEGTLDHFTIDSVTRTGYTDWMIEAAPKQVSQDPLMLFGIYRNLNAPLMRLIVLPASAQNKGKDYMNDWYREKVRSRRGLNSSITDKIDELTTGLSTQSEVMEVLYDYVRQQFKYVAIEIGMGAFIPSPSTEVYENKQGDCKDLSLFLSEALKYKGIESDIALASTFDHISDCDFPSLSSANHVICVAYPDGQAVILDPTDPIHQPGNPVEGIQNRTIFVINTEGGEFIRVPEFTPAENLISYDLQLKSNKESSDLKGTFGAEYRGVSGNFLRWQTYFTKPGELEEMQQKHYKTVFAQQEVSELKTNWGSTPISASGAIRVTGKLHRDGNTTYLFLDFLPRLFEHIEREELLEGMHTGSAFSKEVKVHIELEDPVAFYKPVTHTFNEEGVSLQVKLSNPRADLIICTYDFTFSYSMVKEEHLEPVNTVLNSFKKIINEPLILRSKSL